MQIFDFKHQPTEPSKETAKSFCASTANSIGSSFRHILAKTIDDETDRILLAEPARAAVK
jgi:hypothetical protein